MSERRLSVTPSGRSSRRPSTRWTSPYAEAVAACHGGTLGVLADGARVTLSITLGDG